MKTELVCASSRFNDSVSKVLLEVVADELQIKEIHFWNKQILDQSELKSFAEADTVVIAFGLYFDSLPSHLVSILIQLENFLKENKCPPKKILALANNALYEPEQNFIAIEIIKNWAARTGNIFVQGLGVGSALIIKTIRFKKMFKPIEKALREFALKTESVNSTSKEFQTAKTSCPRWLYIKIINIVIYFCLKKNGLSKRKVLKEQEDILLCKSKKNGQN